MAKVRRPWTPAPEDYAQVFREQNPWHRDGRVPPGLARELERPLARQLPPRLETEPRRYQLVVGPRRVGKTTAMYQIVRRLLANGTDPKRIWWMRLDHPLLIEIPLGSLVHVALSQAPAEEKSPIYLFLDELSYSREWDLWLKTFYDELWPLKIIGTSSSSAALREGRMESGVGRWEEQYLAPYLFSEFLALVQSPFDFAVSETLAETIETSARQTFDLHLLAERRRLFLTVGGFPELIAGILAPGNPVDWVLRSQGMLRTDAVERAVYKDIPQAFGIDDPLMLERLLYVLAAQMAGVLSPSSICKDLGLSLPTFDKYVSYLERAFLIFTLPNFSGNERAVQKRGRKLYFVDGAIRNAALQRGLAALGEGEESGFILENAVASHLHGLCRQDGTRLYHWREGNYEVDLVYDHPSSPLAFEVTTSDRHSKRGLLSFMQRHPRFRGRCYTAWPGAVPLAPSKTSDSIGSLPIDLLLLAASRQAEHALARRLSAA